MEKIEDLKIYIENNKIKIFSIITILLLMMISSLYIYHHFNKKEEPIEVENIAYNDANVDINKENENTKTCVNKTKVDIKGAIKNPGVYEVQCDDRVIDAINMAGGLIDESDTSVTNLSKRLFDEAVIIIYTKEQVNNFIKVKEEEQEKIHNSKENNTIQNNSTIDKNEIVNSGKTEEEETKSDSKISINNATLEELTKVPGIGESKAQNIIDYRNENGSFKTIEDIKNVSGIGDAAFNKIKEYIKI